MVSKKDFQRFRNGNAEHWHLRAFQGSGKFSKPYLEEVKSPTLGRQVYVKDFGIGSYAEDKILAGPFESVDAALVYINLMGLA
jgi:hypothetical protein